MPGTPNGTSQTSSNGTGGASRAGGNGTAGAQRSNGAAPAAPKQGPQRQAKPLVAPRSTAPKSDVDGSTWRGRKSDADVIANMSDREENLGAIAFGAGPSNQEDGSGVDDILGELGLNGKQSGAEFGSADDEDGFDVDAIVGGGEEIKAQDDTEQKNATPEADADDEFDQELKTAETMQAARDLIAAGWDKKTVKALRDANPDALIDTANKIKEGKSGKEPAAPAGVQQGQTFDQALDAALAEPLGGLSKMFDDEGDDKQTISKAMLAPTKAAVGFLGKMVSERIREMHGMVQYLGSQLQTMQLEAARSGLVNDYPGIEDDATFEKVQARAEKMVAGGKYKTIREAMADAAQRELGKQSESQRKVREFNQNRQRAMGSESEGATSQAAGPREVTREQAQELVHAMIERGMSPEQRAQAMRRVKVVKPQPTKKG